MVMVMMRNKIFLLISIVCLFFTDDLLAEIQILFPRSDIVVASTNIHIVAISDSKEEVSIKIGETEIIKKMLPSFTEDGKERYMLMSILRLNSGDNTVTILQGKIKRELVIKKVDSPKVMEDWTENLTNFHSSDYKKDICRNCHRFENIADCLNCHKDRLLGNWVHKPVQDGECLRCHDQANNFLPVQPFNNVCLSCHKTLEEDISKASYLHGPVGAGFCTICHSPHKSTDKTHLRRPVNKLCEQCHVSSDMGFLYHQNSYIKSHPVEAEAVKNTGNELNCASCHNPHFSEDSMLLKIEKGSDQGKLCTMCHDPAETEKLFEQLRK